MSEESKIQIGATFNVGGEVEETGTYVCAPCGYKKDFKKGEKFPRCFKCVEKERYAGDRFMKDLGVWELVG